MTETLKMIFEIPLLWQSLGLVTAISLFISPILYNGDYKTASKSLVIIGGYATFVGLLEISCLSMKDEFGISLWIKPIALLVLVAMSYAFGLFLGVYIHNKSKKRLK